MVRMPTIRIEQRGKTHVAFAKINTPLGQQLHKDLLIVVGTMKEVELGGEIYLLKETISQLKTKICKLKKGIKNG